MSAETMRNCWQCSGKGCISCRRSGHRCYMCGKTVDECECREDGGPVKHERCKSCGNLTIICKC